MGNWFFISEIITTAELEPDESEQNHCGKCVDCIDACPTGAITAPFQLDTRRCIFATIELKGNIQEEFRRRLAGFGATTPAACRESVAGEGEWAERTGWTLIKRTCWNCSRWWRGFEQVRPARRRPTNQASGAFVTSGGAGNVGGGGVPTLLELRQSRALIAEHAEWALAGAETAWLPKMIQRALLLQTLGQGYVLPRRARFRANARGWGMGKSGVSTMKTKREQVDLL